MVGAGTLRTERYGRLVRDPHRREQRVAAGLAADPLAIVVSGRLDLSCDLPLLADAGVARRRRSPRPTRSLDGCAAQVDYLRSSPVDLAGALARAARRARRALDPLRGRPEPQRVAARGGPHRRALPHDRRQARRRRRRADDHRQRADRRAGRRAPRVAARVRRRAVRALRRRRAERPAVRALGPARGAVRSAAMEERDPLDGIGAADAHLGRRVPLPDAAAAARALGRGRRERARRGPGRVEPRRDAAPARPAG